MGARLINVRLAAEDERLVRELQARGISISDVVRRALRAEAAAIEPTAIDARGLIADLISEFPAPSGSGRRRRPRTTDRRAVRKHIAARLQKRR